MERNAERLNSAFSLLIVGLGMTAGTVSDGIEVFSALLVLLSLACFKQLSLSRESANSLMFAVFVLMFAAGITSVFYDGVKVFDIPLRYFLALPVIALLPAISINKAWMLKAFTIGAITSGLYASYLFFVLGQGRIEGGSGIIYTATITLVQALFSLAAAVYFYHKQRVWSYISVIGFISALTAMAMTGTRGAWLAFFPAVGLMILLLIKGLKVRHVLGLGLAGLLIAAFSYTFIQPVQQRADEALSDFELYQSGETYSSVGVRLELWRAGWQEFKQAPLFGLGFKRRGELDVQLQEQGYGLIGDLKNGTGSLHNEVMDALAKRGLFGLLAVLLMYFVPAFYFIRAYRFTGDGDLKIISVLGMAIIITYMFSGLTERLLFHHIPGTFYAFVIPALWSCIYREKRQTAAVLTTA